MNLSLFTQNNEFHVGPQRRLVTLHLVKPRVGCCNGAQGESTGEDVDRRPAGMTGENGLLALQPGHDEGTRHIPSSACQNHRWTERKCHIVTNHSRTDGWTDLHGARGQDSWGGQNNQTRRKQDSSQTSHSLKMIYFVHYIHSTLY